MSILKLSATESQFRHVSIKKNKPCIYKENFRILKFMFPQKEVCILVCVILHFRELCIELKSLHNLCVQWASVYLLLYRRIQSIATSNKLQEWEQRWQMGFNAGKRPLCSDYTIHNQKLNILEDWGKVSESDHQQWFILEQACRQSCEEGKLHQWIPKEKH